MSFHTVLQIANQGFSPIALDGLRERILEILRRDGIHGDFLMDLAEAFENGESTCHVHAAYVLQIVTEVASLMPLTQFAARGLGESFRETWVREFDAGRVTFEVGPWEES